MVILDTSIIIDHLRSPRENSHLELIVQTVPLLELAISVITLQELYQGKSTAISEKEEKMLSIIAPLNMLPYTEQTAEFAGTLVRDTPTSLLFADAAIAATAILNQASLFTLNIKDLEHIENLKLYPIK